MSLPVHVDGYSGWRANERPMGFELDGVCHEIYAWEDQWYSPDVQYFKVRAAGKTYILGYDERQDEWGLESAFDGMELFQRPDVEFITLGVEVIRETVRRIAGCEACRPADAQIPFAHVLGDMVHRRDAVEFVLSETAGCPNCRGTVSEDTLIEEHGGIELEATIHM